LAERIRKRKTTTSIQVELRSVRKRRKTSFHLLNKGRDGNWLGLVEQGVIPGSCCVGRNVCVKREGNQSARTEGLSSLPSHTRGEKNELIVWRVTWRCQLKKNAGPSDKQEV